MMAALVSFLLLLPCVLGEADDMKQSRHLKDIDLSQFRGVRITTDDSIVTLGKKEEIQLFRDPSGVLQIVAPKGVNFVAPWVKTKGKPLGSGGGGGGGDVASASEVAALRKLLEDVGISSNVKRVKGFVCKTGWEGDRCKAPCTNAGAHEFYSGDGCATTKCKAGLKIGFRYTGRTQHSLKTPTIDPGCKQVACTNKNSRQVYIAGTTKAGGDKCNTKTCATSTYISKSKCTPCPGGYTCDGTAKPPTPKPKPKEHSWKFEPCKYFGHQHGESNCKDAGGPFGDKESAQQACLKTSDCEGIVMQTNHCGAKYRITHGSADTHFRDWGCDGSWKAYNLHAYRLTRG